MARRLELALGSLVAILALPGCPISDDYFIEPQATGSGGASGFGGIGGKSGKGDKGGSSGSGGTGGSGVSGGSGAGSGGVPTTCEEPCNAPRTCVTECQDGWITTRTPPGGFSPREKAAYTSIGSQIFIWGGVNESGTALNSGALYDPRTDSWKVVANDAETPTPRSLATAVWTGSDIIVWGGLDPVNMEPLADGAIYDPVADAWAPMSRGPQARSAPVGATCDERIVFYGGHDASGPLGGLDRYNPDMDDWEADTFGSPPAVADPAAAAGTLTFWTYGGRTEMNTGVSNSTYYSMSSQRWLNADSLSPGRWGSFSVFASGSFFVWGGRNLNDFYDDGAAYNVGSTLANWESVSSFGAPSARYATDRESGWAFVMDAGTSNERIVLIAGLDPASTYLGDGAIYRVDSDDWEAIPAWPSASTATHAFGAAGIAAGELVVWGGREGSTLTNQGVRYRPPD